MVEVTNRCNKRCVHCYIPHECKTNDIGDSILFDVLEQCCRIGLKDVTFTGGEPMLHENFIHFLQRAKEYNLRITVYSSLTLLTDDIVSELKSNYIREVQASLYSVDSHIHDTITNLPGSCEMTKDGLLRLAKNGIPVRIACPIMKQNKNSYKDVLQWSKDHNINFITPNCNIIARYDGSKDNLVNRLSLNEVATVLQDILKNDNAYDGERYCENIDHKTRINTLADMLNPYSSSIFISSNADVCPSPGWQSYILGNLRETSFLDIWNNSDKLNRIRGISINDFSKCLKCPDINFCEMSLEGNVNASSDRNPFVIDEHYCQVAALTKKTVLDWKKAHKKVMI
jgi:radical SAM protein with 4Fe4S-binding SPASM domain